MILHAQRKQVKLVVMATKRQAVLKAKNLLVVKNLLVAKVNQEALTLIKATITELVITNLLVVKRKNVAKRKLRLLAVKNNIRI